MSEAAAPAVSADDQEAGHLLLRFGRLLLAAGADTANVSHWIARLARSLDIDAELFVSSERLLLTINMGGVYRTGVGHALGAMGIDAARLAAVAAVGTALESGRIDLAEANRRLAEVEVTPPLYPGWLVVATLGGTAASLARLFGAEWPVVGGAFAAGIVSTVLRRLFARHGINPVIAALMTATISGLVGLLLLKASPESVPTLALVAAGMILVPGVPLINGIADLVTGHTMMGLSRLTNSLVVVLAIGFGLFLAGGMAGAGLQVAQAPGRIAVGEDALFSAIAALGFAMLFDLPRRAVLAGILCGALSHCGRTLLEAGGIDVVSATFPCALLAGLLGCAFGRWLAMPWTVFAFPGVVAMIPGSYAFRGSIGSLQIMAQGADAPAKLIAETLSVSLAALVMTVAIGVGLFVAYALAELSRRLIPRPN